jgi:hypothetical protein
VPALGAAPVHRLVELASVLELVDAEHRDLGEIGVPRHLRWVRHDDAEAAAVAQEVLDLELLIGDDEDIAVEPRAVERREARVVERLHVDAARLDADLRSQPANLDHR